LLGVLSSPSFEKSTTKIRFPTAGMARAYILIFEKEFGHGRSHETHKNICGHSVLCALLTACSVPNIKDPNIKYVTSLKEGEQLPSPQGLLVGTIRWQQGEQQGIAGYGVGPDTGIKIRISRRRKSIAIG
jgi:hypothetical protein